MTQLEIAESGRISDEMWAVAEGEGLEPESVRKLVAEGSVIIPANPNHHGLQPCGIGKGLRTKVNANIGTSSDFSSLETELVKLKAALDARADTVMDLSTGGDIMAIRQEILKRCPVPLGSVPIYQAGIAAIKQHGAIVGMTDDEIFSCIEEHARDGVDFITVHCGVTRKAVERLTCEGRVTRVVSRGGAFLIGWILHNGRENPLYEHFDRLLEIAKEYDVTLSLGDGLRPGSLADASDRAQFEELLTLGELVDRAREAGVQVMVEGPGHLPLDQIEANVKVQKRVCREAPFYVLGPLVTDVAAGYDHISGAIGGAIAAAAGAGFLCYVTPTEHLSLPDADNVREGVIATRIAAHAGDIAKGVNGAWEWDRQMSTARVKLDWSKQLELALDPQRAAKFRAEYPTHSPGCSICGDLCAMKLVSEYLTTERPMKERQ